MNLAGVALGMFPMPQLPHCEHQCHRKMPDVCVNEEAGILAWKEM